MSKITDSSLENLFTVNSHYVMDSLEEAVNFDGKTEEQREEIVRTALKSLEIATIMTCKFFDSETFDADKRSRRCDPRRPANRHQPEFPSGAGQPVRGG